ncbi:MAG: tyrosine--tRNA ligase [bacterium]|nr:tyrosine--tRNA ligase [bacterium]
MKNQEKIDELLTRGVEQIIVKKELTHKIKSGKKLRIKLGVDATAPKMHLGHTVVLRKLKQFMELGHQVIFLVGDFTAKIGDPSDKLSARKSLTDQEIKANMKDYKQQVGMVLDLKKVEFRYNSEWHGNMDFAELFELASLFTVNQMLERDMFQKRMKLGKPLWVHELLYPILQGYDSVALQADVELGGTDQTFNILAAREIQPAYNQTPQNIMTMQLLEGTDGKEKMSKSIGNTINLDESPKEMYGKTMSIPDGLILKYFTLLTDVPLKDIEGFGKEIKKGANPKDYKVILAKELVGIYHNKEKADKAEQEFKSMFKDKKNPTKMDEFKIKKEGDFTILEVVSESGLVTSNNEARRMIEQGAVKFDGLQIRDIKKKVRVVSGMVLQVGKRKFVQLVK